MASHFFFSGYLWILLNFLDPLYFSVNLPLTSCYSSQIFSASSELQGVLLVSITWLFLLIFHSLIIVDDLPVLYLFCLFSFSVDQQLQGQQQCCIHLRFPSLVFYRGLQTLQPLNYVNHWLKTQKVQSYIEDNETHDFWQGLWHNFRNSHNHLYWKNLSLKVVESLKQFARNLNTTSTLLSGFYFWYPYYSPS